MRALALIAWLAQILVTLAVPGSASAAPLALVFGGEGTENDDPTGTLLSAVRAAHAAGFETRIVTEKVPEEVLARASVWIQPGGPNFTQAYDMQRTGVFEQIRPFVEAGGGYVGYCGGGFMAQSSGGLGLGLLPGNARRLKGYTQKIETLWNGQKRFVHFEGGPYFQVYDGIEVFATYAWSGLPAGIKGKFGKGKVVVSGPHPEAQPDWWPEEDPDGSDLELAARMIREAARD